eukprot:2100000-Rhodomonas_salina.1
MLSYQAAAKFKAGPLPPHQSSSMLRDIGIWTSTGLGPEGERNLMLANVQTKGFFSCFPSWRVESSQ